jgi:hypothetical protein
VPKEVISNYLKSKAELLFQSSTIKNLNMNKIINVKLLFVAMTLMAIVSSCQKDAGVKSLAPSTPASGNNFSSSIGNIAEIDVSHGDSVYYWSKSGTVSSGTFTNSTAYRGPIAYTLPAGKTPNDVVAIAIASNNHCYYWYSDGTVSVGYSNNATAYSAPVSYTCAPGQTPTTILAISIAKTSNNVYTWYKNGTATVGSATNLASIRSAYTYTPASGKLISDIVGIGIAGSNDHTWAWYNDGTTKAVSSGYTNILDAYSGATAASF